MVYEYALKVSRGENGGSILKWYTVSAKDNASALRKIRSHHGMSANIYAGPLLVKKGR